MSDISPGEKLSEKKKSWNSFIINMPKINLMLTFNWWSDMTIIQVLEKCMSEISIYFMFTEQLYNPIDLYPINHILRHS